MVADRETNRTAHMSRADLSIRIDLPNGSRLGPGKVALLEAVQRNRSISAAARDLDMSYRRAWLLIDDVNRAFGETAVETFPGRSQGAGAALTPFGARLVAAFRAAERRCRRAADAALADITKVSNPHYAPNVITRSPRKAVRGA